MKSSLRHAGSLIAACRLSSCGAWAQELWREGLVDLWPVGPWLGLECGIEPTSPALRGVFLTTTPSSPNMTMKA